jgi:ornithine carbamoyltransferase
MKDLVSIKNMSKEEIVGLLDFADEIKAMNKRQEAYLPLKNKTVITAFPSTSLRTRISFEVGIVQLGANVINMNIDFEGKEPLEDKVGYLNCWIDYLVVRTPKQDNIEKIATLADFSVVNAMSKESHPCEILSDLQTIRERRGKLDNLKFVFVGEGANICNTWFEAAAKLDLNLTQVCPVGYEIDMQLFEYAKNNSKGDINITKNIEEGLRSADIILTDGWPVNKTDSEGFNKFLPYQIDLKNIKNANKHCIVNPCPPFTRGNEVSEEIIKSNYFIGYGGKENLLHMQKAILASLKK